MVPEPREHKPLITAQESRRERQTQVCCHAVISSTDKLCDKQNDTLSVTTLAFARQIVPLLGRSS